jgi:hypothetical protein
MFSWGYDLYLNDAPLVSFDTSWVWERGSFQWKGVDYDLYRESPWFGDFVVSDGSGILVRATKDSAFLRAFTVRFGDREFRLAAANPFSRRFVLEEKGNTLGEICPAGFLSRKCRGEFPDELPVPVCVFLFWLVVLMWRRQAADGS